MNVSLAAFASLVDHPVVTSRTSVFAFRSGSPKTRSREIRKERLCC